MRSEWIRREEMAHVLAALTPPNRLACEISEATGLRIGDVLLLTREQVLSDRFSVREQKTGKVRRIYLPRELQLRALRMAGPVYVFSGRLDGRKPRTRQAVYKDLCRAARLFRLREHISPHSLRKVWAVEQLHGGKSLKQVQKLLNHRSEAVTMLYAMADELTQRRIGKHGKDDD